MALKTPIFLENDTTTQNADELRLERSYMLNGIPGVLTPGSMAVTQRGAGANMSIDVAAGAAGILGTENALQGMYNVVNDATVNLVISAADATNARWDAVIVRVRDSFYSGGDDDAQFVVVAGTPAASPQVPDLDALGYENYLILAFVSVGASVTSITNGDILDARTRTAALGGTIVCTSATRPTSPYPGMVIYETDTERTYVHNGTTWKYQHGGSNPNSAGGRFSTTSVGSSTFVKLPLQAPAHGNSSIVSTVNNRINVAEAGVYSIKANPILNFGGDVASRYMVMIYKNGGEIMRVSSTVASLAGQEIAIDWYFDVGDHIEFFVWQNSGGNDKNLSASSGGWSVRKVHD